MQVDLASFDNSDYKPGNAFLRFTWYFFNVFFLLNPWNPFMGVKRGVLRLFGAKIGRGVIIKPRVNVKYPWYLNVGNHCWIGEGVWIDNLGPVIIANHVCISQGALLLSGNHNYKKTTFDLMVEPIELETGVWIGAKTIVPGGTLASTHAVLTAGSVAPKRMEPYGIYTGQPAVKVRERKISEDGK